TRVRGLAAQFLYLRHNVGKQRQVRLASRALFGATAEFGFALRAAHNYAGGVAWITRTISSADMPLSSICCLSTATRSASRLCFQALTIRAITPTTNVPPTAIRTTKMPGSNKLCHGNDIAWASDGLMDACYSPATTCSCGASRKSPTRRVTPTRSRYSHKGTAN